jgi:hypothetical protein
MHEPPKGTALSAANSVVAENQEWTKAAARRFAAHVLLRRQSRARLLVRQARHQVHQQPRRHARRRPGSATDRGIPVLKFSWNVTGRETRVRVGIHVLAGLHVAPSGPAKAAMNAG